LASRRPPFLQFALLVCTPICTLKGAVELAHDPTISARVSSILRIRLKEKAADEGVNLSSLVERLLRAGLDLPPPPPPPDGPLVKATKFLFVGLEGEREDFRRFAAVELARIAERGGLPAVRAIHELLALGDQLFHESDTTWQEYSEQLRTPVYTDENGRPREESEP
jgi:hypothetical protein